MLNHSPPDADQKSLSASVSDLSKKPLNRYAPPTKVVQEDPVCGMIVDERRAKLKSDHEGRTFYFCSAGCKAAFDRDPHRYAH